MGRYKNKTYIQLCDLRKDKIKELKQIEQVMKDYCAGVGKYTGTGGNYKKAIEKPYSQRH